MVENIERIMELFNSGIGKTNVARKICEEQGIEFNQNNRRSVGKLINKRIDKGIFDECETVGIDFDKVKHYWYKGEHYSINVKGVENDSFNYHEFKQDFIDTVERIKPNHIKIERNDLLEDLHCLLIDPADIHVNKLCSAFETGEDYNSQIAVQRVKEGVSSIIKKSNGFSIDKIILIVGNDVLNTDNTRNSTTKLTPQDTHLKWFDAFIMAKQLYIDIIETLVQIADLEIIYNVSNHDEMSGFFLMDSLYSWYNTHENITFNRSPAHRKYTTYGKNLIGTTHGDGAKQNDLPLLMCHEASQHWHDCKHRYWFTHHVHHKTSRDIMSVQIESLRSPSPADSWHHKSGYQHSPLAIEGFIFHKEFGQVARLTTLFSILGFIISIF
jgi:uncharacterized protein YktA (UPF0223 family)